VERDAAYHNGTVWPWLIGPFLEARQMSLQMSNDDFEWQKGRGPFVEGIASPENPTGQLYEQFRTWRAERKIYLAPIREWLSALNDPKRFISAHMLLLCAAEEKWRQTAHGSATWREANFRRVPRLKRTTQPVTGEGVLVDTVIYLPADSSGTGPDLSVQQSLLQEWRGLLNVPRGEIFQGWVALGLLVVPLAWITQPHTQARKWRRWTFNAVATISLMIFLLSGVVWARSVQSDTQFMFEPRPAKSVAGLSDKFLSYRWIGFTGGRLKLLEMKVPESWKQVYEAVARGFQPIDGLQYQTAKASGFVGIGEKIFDNPGLRILLFAGAKHDRPGSWLPARSDDADDVRRHLHFDRMVDVDGDECARPCHLGLPRGRFVVDRTTAAAAG
jgi:hypothetical protein